MSLKSSLVVLGVALCLPALAVAQTSAAPGIRPAAAARVAPDAGGIGPLNTTVGSAIVLPPDGTAVEDNNGDGVTQWFVSQVESAKSYVLDVFHPFNDVTGNAISVALFDSDGTTAWSGGVSDCSAAAASAAPSLQGSSDTTSSSDGARCVIRPFTALTPATPRMFIRVTAGFSGSFVVRLRENTVYTRYTVNGYNMFVPVHNVSAQSQQGYVTFYGSNAANSTVTTENFFSLGPFQATQIVRNAGTINPVTGTIRVILEGPATDVSIQAYAFNSGANQYLIFTPERFNNVPGKSF